MKIPLKFLSSYNITKACKTSKTYKGLYFSNKPLHEEIHVEKLDNIGER